MFWPFVLLCAHLAATHLAATHLAATTAGGAVDAQAATAAATSSSSSSARECVRAGRVESGDVALASLFCVEDGVLVEERFIERKKVRDEKTVHTRKVALPLRLAAAPTISEDDEQQHHRHALIDATRRLAAVDYDVGALLALLRDNEAAREVLARALSTSASPELHPIFGQDLPAVPWVQLQGAAVFSPTGQLLAVSHAHGAPPRPAGDGYGGYVSVLLKTSDLSVAYRAPGFILGFDHESPIVTAVIARCDRAPATAGEFFTPGDCPDHGDERWEAVIDVAAGKLHDVRGPFHKNSECGEAGPEDVPARYQWCVP